MKPYETAMAIAGSLTNLEQALEGGDVETAKAEAATLHDQLRTGLYQHGAKLGLVREDIANIDNFGPQARGGEPKNPPQAEEAEA